MKGNINELSGYSIDDVEKLNLIREVLLKSFDEAPLYYREVKFSPNIECQDYYDESEYDAVQDDLKLESPPVPDITFKEDVLGKYCPQCGRKYPKSENVCMDCLVHLKNISDKTDVADITSHPRFDVYGKNTYSSFEELLDESNLLKISKFDFSMADYSQILHNIKSQAFGNFDGLVKENDIDFDGLDILEKIILFTKSFVNVEYKSYGGQLGYFESDSIFIDDRQTKSLQITSLIHELSHFLIQEMLIHIICRVLDCSSNSLIRNLAVFILSYSHFTQLIDEYAAHNVEGRFTIFGFQDYSSFVQIERSMNGEMTDEEIEITKSIGNTFSLSIKGILESLIDRQMREDIKEQFLKDALDRPNYRALEMENCQILNDEGLIKAIWLILNDGFEAASSNIDKLISISKK